MRTALFGVLIVVGFLAHVPPARANGPRAFAQAYARVEPSVVMIEATNGGKVVRRGSGFVASADGLVVCASYTVERAKHVRVHVGTSWREASIVGIDTALRVALLRVAAGEALRPVAVAKRATLVEGQWVVAVERRASGKARPIAGTVALVPRNSSSRSLQPPVAVVDAPTMAGSPLVNLKGEVVGISLGRIDARRGRATSLDPARAFFKRAAAGVGAMP